MYCFLLAGGLGSRLRPLTDVTPKCLLQVAGKPMLGYWLDKLSQIQGVDEVIINTHHLPDKVRTYIDLVRDNYYFAISLFHEPRLLGSAGTLYANRERLAKNDNLVIYADNFSSIDLSKFHQSFLSRQDAFHVAVFESESPESCGIFEASPDGTVHSFEEKPLQPRSNLANAGIYMFQGKTYLELVTGRETDIGYDVIPNIVDYIRIFKIDGYHLDIGTPLMLEKASTLALSLIS